MAQAFKFPTEAKAVTARPGPSEPGAGAPPGWIAAPDRSGSSRIVRQQYGPAPGWPQACEGPADAAAAVPIPGPGDPDQVNQSGPI